MSFNTPMKLEIEVYSNAHLHKLDCQNRPIYILTSNSQALKRVMKETKKNEKQSMNQLANDAYE